MSTQLSVIRLSKCFEKGSVNEKVALDNFSLEVSRGEFVTILGSNGAGKSTLFNAILGKFLPDGGKIVLDGEDITRQKEAVRCRRIARIYQNPAMGTCAAWRAATQASPQATRLRWRSCVP